MEYELYNLTCSNYKSINIFSNISSRNLYNNCDMCLNYLEGKCVGRINEKYIKRN